MRREIKTALFLTFISTIAAAQTKEEKVAKKHQESIQKSREKGTVILDQDTIYNAGAAYAVLKNEGTMMVPKYRAYTLSGKEAFTAVPVPSRNLWQFAFNSLKGKQVEVPMDVNTPIAAIIVKNELFLPQDLNEGKTRYFAVKFGPHKTGTIPGAEIEQVKRNRSGIILAYGNKIFQDGKEIGSYETKTERTEEYGSKKVCYIYFPGGALCAKGILGAGEPGKAAITTQMDDKTGFITDEILEVDDIATYLVKGNYL